ncbi:MAG: hypothetical protein ABI477_20745 [Chryseolinea sp.]
MPNVTYLFGAGASAKTLPTVPEMPARLYDFKEVLIKGDGMDPAYGPARDSIVGMINNVLNEIIDVKFTHSTKMA